MRVLDKIVEKLYFKQKYNLALYDQLTGLYNHNWLIRIGLKKYDKERVYVYMADINNLKIINDTEGHEKANRVIKNVAIALKRIACSDTDDVVRYGGDEFIIISQRDIYKKLERIPDISVGKKFKHEYYSTQRAIIDADNMMYENKKRNRKVQEVKYGNISRTRPIFP